eukprot:TRINITY_DN1807_c0_g1_i2.p1 TRINITY_DN1807_c0_g1~~TRINITY_DN1807_c0_g1_i2.p1  ORF type:complete len:507 (-),score=131.06 TRINITY_DN1807_c0_g1_i2:307-1827(-)
MSIHPSRAKSALLAACSGEIRRTASFNTKDMNHAEVSAQLKAVVETVLDGIVVISSTGVIEHFNPAAEKQFLYRQEEILGRNVSELMAEPHRSQHDEYLRRYIETGHKSIIGRGREVEGLRSDGTTFPLELSVSEMRIGDEIKFTGMTRDVTDRKRAEAEAAVSKALAESKSAFLSLMSHELRTPLTGMIGMASVLQNTELTSEQKDCLNIIQLCGNQLLNLINDILDLGKMEKGELTLEEREVDVRKCIEEVTELVSPAATSQQVDLAYDIAGQAIPSILGDSLRLRQILTNLLSNAIKFTSACGYVHVRVSSAPKQPGLVELHFEVEDTGIGIPDESKSKLFRAFSQAHVSTSRKYGGTGLGLSICKSLTEMMGGSIYFDSVVGRGTTFHFTILAKTADGPMSEQSREAMKRSISSEDCWTLQSGQGMFNGWSAAVIDRQPVVRSMLKSWLEIWGMEVAEYSDPAELVAAVPVAARIVLSSAITTEMRHLLSDARFVFLVSNAD